jgi:uncharacterized membrane protein
MTATMHRPGTSLEPDATPLGSLPEASSAEAPPATAARGWWGLVMVGGLAGIVTAAWQTVERIQWASAPAVGSVCDLSATISCSSVFSEWQSSALGVPNSLIALPVFAMIASAGLGGVLRSRPSNAYTASMLGLSVFMTLFVTWYLAQSAFVMDVLCLFCLGCGVAILAASVGLTRVAAAQRALGSGRAGRSLDVMVRSGSDLIAWGGLAVVVALMLVLGLGLL